jgi:hypothetical protein
VCIPLVLGLVAWHGWLTSQLFGPEPWSRLGNEEPLLSGRHPLHLYHGYLGARALLREGTLSCYDPGYQAGYPKTPVFDSGSRPAELMLALAGGSFSPAAYKIGVAVFCLLVPIAALLAAWGLGCSAGETVGLVVLVLLVWWGRPCRELLEMGDLDLLLATLATLAQVGLLIRHHRQPGVLPWLGVMLTGFLAWFAHPLLCAAFLGPFLIYYLSVGVRHGFFWHLFLLCGLLAALGCNYFWLHDWVRFWWMRLPPETPSFVLPHRTLATLWHAELWGPPLDRVVSLSLIGLGLLGGVIYNQTGGRPQARVLGFSAGGLLLVATGGLLWDTLGRFGVARLQVSALLLLAPLAVHALWRILGLVLRLVPRPVLLAATACAALTAAFLALPAPFLLLAERCRQIEPLAIGWQPEQQQLLDLLRAHTTGTARILWEDHAVRPLASHWSPLLSLTTERSYIGGLDPEAWIEHTEGGLREQTLWDRPLGDWTDSELEEYCTRYNIGWIACWSPAAVERFSRWGLAERSVALPARPDVDEAPGWLFALRRQHSYTLKGRVKKLHAEPGWIALEDVVPENGEVVICFHHQSGLQVAPSRVRLERDLDPRDPIPLIRLRVAGPVAHLTITWRR